MWSTGVSESWLFIIHEAFPLWVDGYKYMVFRATYKDKWKGYIYINHKSGDILCFDEIVPLLSTLKSISEDMKNGR